MHPKLPIAPIAGLVGGNLLAQFLGVYVFGRSWNWTGVFGTIVGALIGAVIFGGAGFLPPEPANAQMERRRQLWVTGLMLLSLIALLLTTVFKQAASFLFIVSGGIFIAAFVVGLIYLDPARRKVSNTLIVIALALLGTMLTLAVLARSVPH